MLGIYHELVYLFFEKISKLLAKRSKQILYHNKLTDITYTNYIKLNSFCNLVCSFI